MDNQFVKVAVRPVAKTQIDILSAIKGTDKYAFVGDLVADAWETAKAAGLVNDEMLTNVTVTSLPRPEGAQVVPVVSISTGQA